MSDTPPLHRILYVEDEPDIQEIARLSLEQVGGFELRICSSGSEALQAVDEFVPDLILLDAMMPGMDGLETMAELRRLPVTRDTPVVFMTAKVRTQELLEYKEAGALDVIAKPFDPLSLPDQLRGIWSRKDAL